MKDWKKPLESRHIAIIQGDERNLAVCKISDELKHRVSSAIFISLASFDVTVN